MYWRNSVKCYIYLSQSFCIGLFHHKVPFKQHCYKPNNKIIIKSLLDLLDFSSNLLMTKSWTCCTNSLLEHRILLLSAEEAQAQTTVNDREHCGSVSSLVIKVCASCMQHVTWCNLWLILDFIYCLHMRAINTIPQCQCYAVSERSSHVIQTSTSGAVYWDLRKKKH